MLIINLLSVIITLFRDGSGKVPYLLARDKPTRDTFRRFMNNFPGAYDYVAAQVCATS